MKGLIVLTFLTVALIKSSLKIGHGNLQLNLPLSLLVELEVQ